jgi:hypothetical protein
VGLVRGRRVGVLAFATTLSNEAFTLLSQTKNVLPGNREILFFLLSLWKQSYKVKFRKKTEIVLSSWTVRDFKMFYFCNI